MHLGLNSPLITMSFFIVMFPELQFIFFPIYSIGGINSRSNAILYLKHISTRFPNQYCKIRLNANCMYSTAYWMRRYSSEICFITIMQALYLLLIYRTSGNVRATSKIRYFDINNRKHIDLVHHITIAKHKIFASQESMDRILFFDNFNLTNISNVDILGFKHQRLNNSEVNVSLLENVYLSRHISTDDGFITTSYIPRPDMVRIFPFLNMKCVGYYDTGVFITCWWEQFGHLIHDFLCSLMFLPKELYYKDFVMLAPPTGARTAAIWLQAFDFMKNVRFVELGFQERVHVENLYVLGIGAYSHGYTIAGIPKVRDILFKYYNLTKITPTEYKIINRQSKYRLMLGIDELLIEINKIVKLENNKKWIIDTYSSSNISDIIRTFSTIKVLITPQGSGVYNCIFMQPKTGILLFTSRSLDGPNCMLGAAGDYFMISVAHWQIGVYSQGAKCDAKNMAAMTKLLIESVNRGHFPNSDPRVVKAFPFMYERCKYVIDINSPFLY